MSNKKIWFITGASRGMGADFAKASLVAGHCSEFARQSCQSRAFLQIVPIVQIVNSITYVE